MDMSKAWVMLSPGEVADKISVLELKQRKGFDVAHELHDLQVAMTSLGDAKGLDELRQELDEINAQAGEKVDRIYQIFEDFSEEKPDMSKEAYRVCSEAHFLNKRRVQLKNKINVLMGCKDKEVKTWKPSIT